MDEQLKDEINNVEIIVNSILTEFANKKIKANVGVTALSNIIQGFCIFLTEEEIDKYINSLRDGAKEFRAVYIKNKKRL